MHTLYSFFFTKTPLVFLTQSFWRDEAFSYLLSKQPIISLLANTAKDSNPPFYYLFLHFWMKLFGYSELSVRLVSLLFFWGIIYVSFLYLTNIMKIPVKKAFLFIFLVFCNPVLHYYAFEARPYAMFCFFSLLSFYFFLTKDKKKYLIFSILGIFTHYFMFFVFLTQGIYCIVNKKNREIKQDLLHFVYIALAFLPWFIFVLCSKPPLTQEFWIKKSSFLTFLNLPAILFTGFEDLLGYTYPPLTILSLLLYAVVIWGSVSFLKKNVNKPEEFGQFVFLGLWAFISPVVVTVVSLYRPIFIPRYVLFSSLGFLYLLIFIAYHQTNRKITWGILLLCFIFSMHYGTTQIAQRKKEDVRTPLKEIRSLMKQDDVVYVTSELNFHAAQYYVDEKRVFIYGKTYDTIPWYVGKVLIPKKDIAISLPTYPRRAFILNDDLSYTIQAQY